MRDKLLRLFFIIACLSIYMSAFAQENIEVSISGNALIDSLKNGGVIFKYSQKRPEIILSTNQAVRFLQQRYQPRYWNDLNDPLRLALEQLIFEASHNPIDSVTYLLKNFPYDSLNIPWDKFYIWEPLRIKVPSLPPSEFTIPADSVVIADTNIVEDASDSLRTDLLTIPDPFDTLKPVAGLIDSTIMVVIDTLDEATISNSVFPFRYLNSPFQGDSIQVAVNSLLKDLEERDSSVIKFKGVDDREISVWMNSKNDIMMRYWLKNELYDSITVWIGTPSKNTFGLYLEQGVNFRRPSKKSNYSDAKINIQSLDNSKLLEVQKIVVKRQYWKYRTENSFILSQASLTNWVKGGESSISTAMDITGYADFNNKTLKLSSNNFVRLKLGFLTTGDYGIRKNLDLLETNSKLNHKAFGKFEFSSIMLFKTQVANGFNYPNDSIPVSKFMNPAILTIGFGLDYKPNKSTSINFSPLSYKGTFVPDTAHIDQTKYGILKDKKSKNEPGASFMISNKFEPFKNFSITNRLQLFTNYVHNPQNIDIDWEMIVVASLNWFTDVRFNTHFIFDDDTKTVELDKDKNPVSRPDGTPKKTARPQFKEMLGFSFVFRF
ncbi:MAG TPA: DUF3078 domain-containing protein [Bacteroidales bacterium]|nr:DUF3078 domain-containing protein [Bacteroidales bacterium]